jgi:putative methionine-R-sulfoxide reductase with GAF domain
MPLAAQNQVSQASRAPRRGSLQRQIILILLFLSLVPTLLSGIATFLRTRSLLYQQTEVQLRLIVQNQVDSLRQLANGNQASLERLARNEDFIQSNAAYWNNPNDPIHPYRIKTQFREYLQPATTASYDTGFDEILILGSHGEALISTNANRPLQQAVGSTLLSLLDQDGTVAVYDLDSLYPGQFAFVSVHSLAPQPATLVGIAATTRPAGAIAESNALLASAQTYYLTGAGQVLGLNPSGQNLVEIPAPQAYLAQVQANLQAVSPAAVLYPSIAQQTVYGFGQQAPDLGLSVLFEVPQQAIEAQSQSLLPFYVVLLAASLLVIGVLVTIFSAQIVTPLNQLINSARAYAAGDWESRVAIHRQDEIGLLGQTLNTMAGELSHLYQSLEQKVEDRTRQARIASEVVQLATSSLSRSELIQSAADLIIDRFGYEYAGIFLLEQGGISAVLESQAFRTATQPAQTGARVMITPDSIVGWVLMKNQPRIIPGEDGAAFDQRLIELPEAQSEIAVPISTGNQIFGVLDIYSAIPDAFDADTRAVLSALGQQIASALEKVRLIESTKINLEETTILYQASRQITHSKSDEEVIERLDLALEKAADAHALFQVDPGSMIIVGIHSLHVEEDRARTRDATLPLKTLPPELAHKNPLVINDLRQDKDLSQLLALIFHRECRSAAIFTVDTSEQLIQVAVVGSRTANRFTETYLQPYANLIDVASNTLSRLHLLKSLEDRLDEVETLATIGQRI